jgi:hypothetical protein
VIPSDYLIRARDASRDAERCRRQLEQLESQALSIGGGGFEPRTRSTPDPKRMEKRVDRLVDREKALEARMDEDYAIVDRATSMIYGDSQDGHGGVSDGLGPEYADVLWWRYLDDAKWAKVADVMGYAKCTCQQMCTRALDWMDATYGDVL